MMEKKKSAAAVSISLQMIEPPIIEQQDDEITTSPMSSSSIDTSFLEKERQAREEMQQFEELEKECASTRRGVRVTFDEKRLLPMAQTTLIKLNPIFKLIQRKIM